MDPQARPGKLVHCFAQANVTFASQLLGGSGNIFVESNCRTHTAIIAWYVRRRR
ncbi:MAG: hypothetical protein ACRDMV_09045 [Streptosporangiales bacterium]